jgi:hypothetical protein
MSGRPLLCRRRAGRPNRAASEKGKGNALLTRCQGARDLAREIAKTEVYQTSRRHRKKVEMLFAHLKRILKLDRLRLRGPNRARDEFHLAATALSLRKLAMLVPAAPPKPAW